eukprot:527647-Pyramimonas_sp.AAC.1
MSSAKRKFAMLVPGEKPSLMPNLLRCQLGLSCRRTCSKSALDKNELSGSPCFTPRWIEKLLLLVSVRTVAVWSSY